ncbi:MAG: hypothetical protein EBY20_01485 [Alphaproteobacteria bacterium]|uniref:Uncharacterized protein n=1 Tax=viral metagenome TaxID=1070528 RepID=A0A6C0HRX6_9ZZZZ|nr:hypothetical protein [Alphaproteobacteria bacterium]
MYDAFYRMHKAYHSKYSYNPSLIIGNKNLKNTALMKYANESLKKSIRKIQDRYNKDTNYKLKKNINRELTRMNHVNSDAHFILDVTIFSGICLGLLSTYLVNYFMNR